MPRIILDVMGGDRGPHAVLEGALKALPDLLADLVLVGDESVLRKTLQERKYRKLQAALEAGRIQLIHASETIEMDDSIKAVRSKPNSSINLGCKLAAQDWEKGTPSAFISAGHSGAMMASALLNMGRLKGVERPGIAVTLPTLAPQGAVLLDVGANVDCKPEHLRDFAHMGAVYAQVAYFGQNSAQNSRQEAPLPRIGLLSNGEERSKGNEQVRAAATLIENSPITPQVGKFLGYVEGKEIFKGQVDVVVTDGFVGNVVLKSLEGLGSAVVSQLKQEAKRHPLTFLGFIFSSAAFRRLKRKLDYAEYGAAPLLGVAGYAFICHGRSNPKAIRNALLRARDALQSGFVEKLEKALIQNAKQVQE